MDGELPAGHVLEGQRDKTRESSVLWKSDLSWELICHFPAPSADSSAASIITMWKKKDWKSQLKRESVSDGVCANCLGKGGENPTLRG